MYRSKINRISKGGQANADEGRQRGVSQKVTKDDEGGGVWIPPKLADIICEQHLIIISVLGALCKNFGLFSFGS